MSKIYLGIIGGGQLGSMLSTAAKQLNIHTIIYCDDLDAPAQNFCDEFIFGKYSDKQKIEEFINKKKINYNVPVGKALRGVLIKIEKKNNEFGKILVSGSSLMRGYLSKNKNLLKKVKKKWFETGDIGFFDHDKNLILMGRDDDTFRVGHEKLCPEEIEPIIKKKLKLQEVIIGKSKNSILNWEPVLVLSKREFSKKKNLISELKKHLNKYKNRVKIKYIEEKKPLGTIGSFRNINVKNKRPIIIIYSDIFTNFDLEKMLNFHAKTKSKITIIGKKHYIQNPYGVLKINKKGKLLKILEKPKSSKSNLAVTGLYFFDNKVIKLSKSLKPSSRNELEITDLLNCYRRKNQLKAL